MNDKIEVVMRLVAADWPNCSKSEILEHLPDMVEVADAILAAAGAQQPTPSRWYKVAMQQVDEIDAFRARAEAAEANVARLERQLAPLAEDEAEAAFSEWDGVGTEYLGMMRRDIAIMAVKARRSE